VTREKQPHRVILLGRGEGGGGKKVTEERPNRSDRGDHVEAGSKFEKIKWD